MSSEVFKQKELFLDFFANFFRIVSGKIQAGLSKLPSTCPEELLEDIVLNKKIVQKHRYVRPQKLWRSLSKVHFTFPDQCFQKNHNF